jgi:hypothetical protein
LNKASDKLFEVHPRVPEKRITKDLQYISKFMGENKYERYLVEEYLKKDNLPAE